MDNNQTQKEAKKVLVAVGSASAIKMKAVKMAFPDCKLVALDGTFQSGWRKKYFPLSYSSHLRSSTATSWQRSDHQR